MELIAHNFWWLRMGHYVADQVKGFSPLKLHETFPASSTSKLMPTKSLIIAGKSFESI